MPSANGLRALTGITGAALLAAGPAWAADWQPRATGKGAFADLTADAHTGTDLVVRQMAQPLQGPGSVPVLVITLLLAVLAVWPLRLWALRRLGGMLRTSYHHAAFATFAKAFATVVITTICFVICSILLLIGVNISSHLLPEVADLVNVLVASCIFAGIGLGLGTAFRSPDDKGLRPLELPPGLGRTIASYSFAAGIMLGLVAFIDTASQALHASSTSWNTAQILLLLVEIVMITRFLVQAGRARERLATEAPEGEAPGAAIFGAATVAWGALAVVCGALALGYLRFAANLAQGMLWAAMVLAIAWLTTRFVDTLVLHFLGSERRAARFATGIVGVQKARVEQAAVLISAAFGVIVWSLAVAMALLPILGTGDNVVQQVRPGPVMESIRAMHLSPRSFFAALGLLVLGIVVTRMIRHWFEQRFLPSTSLGIGARTSITTGLTYVGTITALVMASGALGLRLDKITLIASALTVGVGFGLQAIIQNFVSGVILLFERPIQPGDRVVVSGSEGKVHRMRVRATELVADDGSIAIIPNSAFISSTVINKGDKPGDTAVELDVTVSECDGAAAACDLLTERLASCDAVAKTPQPKLHLRTLGQRSWVFGLRFHPARDDPRERVVNDLLLHLGKTRADGVAILVG